MKIAAVTEDGTTISQHFGRAPFYMVFTMEDGKVARREKRDKVGHQTFAGQGHSECSGDGRHGTGTDAWAKHAAMAGSIDDCDVLLAGGMGWGAYESMNGRGITTIVTDVADIEEAVGLYVAGKLPNLMKRVH